MPWNQQEENKSTLLPKELNYIPSTHRPTQNHKLALPGQIESATNRAQPCLLVKRVTHAQTHKYVQILRHIYATKCMCMCAANVWLYMYGMGDGCIVGGSSEPSEIWLKERPCKNTFHRPHTWQIHQLYNMPILLQTAAPKRSAWRHLITPAASRVAGQNTDK